MKYLKYNEEKSTILVKCTRLSYPHLFEKWAMEGDDEGKARYSGKFLLNKETHAEEIKWLRQHLVALQKEWFKGKIGSDRLFFRDGDDTGKEEQEGTWVISAGDPKRRPQVLAKDKSPVTEDDDVVYAGAYVHVLIRPWKQGGAGVKSPWGSRINANLIGVQAYKDGERFGEEPIDASEEFDDEDDGDTKSKSKSKAKSRSDDDDFDDDDDLDD